MKGLWKMDPKKGFLHSQSGLTKFKISFTCQQNNTHFTCQQSNAQNPSSQASTVHEPRTSTCTGWIQKRQGKQRQVANIHWIIEKAREFQKNIYFCFIECAKAFDCVDHKKLWKILSEMGIPDHLTCLLRNLYTGLEASQNWTWNNGLFQNWERSTSRLYVFILII